MTSGRPTEQDFGFTLAVQSSGLLIEASPWSTTGPAQPDLIHFSFVGSRGGVKAQVAMTPEAAEFYWRKLGNLLGKDES